MVLVDAGSCGDRGRLGSAIVADEADEGWYGGILRSTAWGESMVRGGGMG